MSERLQQLLRLHTADPKDPFCTYGIALEHAKSGAGEEALRWLDQTIQTDPKYCYAYFQRGKILADMGREEEARSILKQGIRSAIEAGDAHAREEITGLLDSIGN